MVWDGGYRDGVFFGEFWIYFRGINFVSNSQYLGCLGGTLDFICEKSISNGCFGKYLGGDRSGGVGEDIPISKKISNLNDKCQMEGGCILLRF